MNQSFEAQYHLNGIVVHRGQNLANGHYIAYVRNGNDWVELDDEVATSVAWETVKTQQAYILFFETDHEANTSADIDKNEKTDAIMEEVDKSDVMRVVPQAVQEEKALTVQATIAPQTLEISSDDSYDPQKEKVRDRKRKQRKAKKKWHR